MEMLYDNGELEEELDHADGLMKRAMRFMIEAFQSLKI